MKAAIRTLDIDAMIRFGSGKPMRRDIAQLPQIIPQLACFELRQDEIVVVMIGGGRYSIDAKIEKEF